MVNGSVAIRLETSLKDICIWFSMNALNGNPIRGQVAC